MPAKRIILLEQTHALAPWYRYVLWADVPAGNQAAYRKPQASSAFANATAAELQAIRDGLVAEKVDSILLDSGNIATVQTALEARWTTWQADVTAAPSWLEYGRHWTGAAWVASPGVPISVAETTEGLPTYFALTPVSSFAANRYHFVLYNGVSTVLGQGMTVKVRLVVVKPGLAAVTGAMGGTWDFRRRQSPTTPPTGGTFGVALADSGQPLPAGITLHNIPTTAPAGGTISAINTFSPQADELKLTTADAPTLGALYGNWAGQVVYNARDVWPAKPITLRAGETVEVQQGSTAGVGACQVLCVFTIG